MAKRKSTGRRDAPTIAKGYSQSVPDPDVLFSRPLPTLPFQSAIRSPLYEVEDRRVFQPDRLVSKSSRRNLVRLTLAKPKPGRHPAAGLREIHRLTFRAPRFVAVCVRRKRRKEVLFALMKTGKGSSTRRARRTLNSSISCKG